ncbi:hypothetical protein K469DRAFT_688770 [Zopfia rhizophila CBS 207.26]|uniref:DUF7025 domain-containing protein n=1 Tax=Zopfia rhizophila CBS 207.26 TaxID=1314779 RepID=A0A6A6DZU0_9PEZI|nr:hypothetical protein K469DRAFT_688770 [Zopfia rhizophila CBS 207.26]
MKQNGSTTQPTVTPPSSPNLSPNHDAIVFRIAQKIADALGIIAAGKALPEPASYPETPEGPAKDDLKPEETKARASKLAYKKVDEVWDEKAYKYKIAEPVAPTGEVNELELYVFVVRVRVVKLTDKTTKDTTSYIDIKSELLRDILKEILQDVRGISLSEDMPTVEPILLFHFLPELESYRSSASDNSENTLRLKHLGLLIDFIKTSHKSTAERLASLLRTKEITYDLLPALFKANSEIYTTCRGTSVSRCFKYNYGEERTEPNGSKFFYIEGRYIDFDGNIAFQVKEKGEIASQHVKSRIMVDAAFFQQMNPDYPAPRVYKSRPVMIDIFSFGLLGPDRKDSRVKYVDIDPDRMKDHEFLVCGLAVLGFGLDDKLFNSKGQKRVLLLHGPPGVRKTLTAEATSEYLKTPLYVLPTKQLGTDAVEVEKILSNTFKLPSY